MTVNTKYNIGDKMYVFEDLSKGYDYKLVEIEDIHTTIWKKGHTSISYRLKGETFLKNEDFLFTTSEELIASQIKEYENKIELIKSTSKEL